MPEVQARMTPRTTPYDRDAAFWKAEREWSDFLRRGPKVRRTRSTPVIPASVDAPHQSGEPDPESIPAPDRT